jgi:hypothetical protein
MRSLIAAETPILSQIPAQTLSVVKIADPACIIGALPDIADATS